MSFWGELESADLPDTVGHVVVDGGGKLNPVLT